MGLALVSVIMPVYNAGLYLREAIESVLQQTHTNLELIAVNDGSSDNSLEICKEYASKDDRVKVINQSNSGVSVARNRALDAARGEFISFVDADDWIKSDFIEQHLKHFVGNIGVVESTFTKVYVDALKSITKPYYGEFESRNLYRLYIDGKLSSVLCDKVYRREVIGHLRMPVGHTMGEDAYFLSDLYHRASFDVKVINYDGYNYRMQELSAMNTVHNLQFMVSSFRQYEHRYELSKSLDDNALIQKNLTQLLGDFVQYYRLLAIGRAADKDGDTSSMYEELARWVDKYGNLCPDRKKKYMLWVFHRFPAASRLYFNLCKR